MGQRADAPVLIVEDDLDARDALEQLIAARGYATATADDGLDALQYLRSGGEAAAIVLDLRMPNMDGWTFRRVLHDDPQLRDIPVIVFSCDPTASRLAGVVGVVFKGSTDPAVLIDFIEKAVGRPARGGSSGRSP